MADTANTSQVALSSTLFVALWFVLGLVRRFSKETKDTT